MSDEPGTSGNGYQWYKLQVNKSPKKMTAPKRRLGGILNVTNNITNNDLQDLKSNLPNVQVKRPGRETFKPPGTFKKEEPDKKKQKQT